VTLGCQARGRVGSCTDLASQDIRHGLKSPSLVKLVNLDFIYGTKRFLCCLRVNSGANVMASARCCNLVYITFVCVRE